MSKRLPLGVRLWLWRHRRHGTCGVNTNISVPMWDPSAKGILTECSCGKSGAW